MARIANSLAVLRAQIDAAYPNRKKTSDGWLGDAAHQARKSDHNPNIVGVVQALDITHDPPGMDTYRLAEALRANRDPRIKYVISNGKIFSSLVSPWQWRTYTGSNAHDRHIHISVDDDPSKYDDGRAWNLDLPKQVGSQFSNITATVFGGPGDEQPVAYADVSPGWANRPGVALPYRFPGDRPIVQVRHKSSQWLDCQIVDVGPWNIKDPYWLTGTRPQAESGFDLSGRKTNLAGIDLTPEAARIIDLPGKGLVDWRFKQEQPMAEVATATAAELAVKLKQVEEAMTALGLVLKEMQKAVAALQTPAPAPVPAPATPILEKPGVGLGVFGGVLTALLQWAGIADVTQAGSVSQLLPLASAGIAGLGMTGVWGPLIGIGLQLLTGLMQKK